MQEVLVVVGPAGAGKSTVRAALAARSDGICAIDGDAIASASSWWDYDEF